MRLLERIVLVVYILCIASLVCLWGWADSQFKNIQTEQDRVKPQIEKIVEYADDDPEIKKEPPDIIEEDEDEIIEEIEEEEIVEDNVVEIEIPYPEVPLTSAIGKVQGPQEVETYYNLPMTRVLEKMRSMGYTEEEYPYYVREDGMKMIGDYIMVATDLNTMYPRGTIVQTSRGQGIICDHCETPDVIDIAVEW